MAADRDLSGYVTRSAEAGTARTSIDASRHSAPCGRSEDHLPHSLGVHRWCTGVGPWDLTEIADEPPAADLDVDQRELAWLRAAVARVRALCDPERWDASDARRATLPVHEILAALDGEDAVTTGSIPEAGRGYAAELEARVRWAILHNNGRPPSLTPDNEALAVFMVTDTSKLDQGQQDRALSQVALRIGGTCDDARALIAHVRSRPLREAAADPREMITVPADVRVRIDDLQATRDITPGGMRKALTAMGWERSGTPDLRETYGFCEDAHESEPVAERWERNNHTVALPISAGTHHDPLRMRLNLIRDVAEVHDVSELAVWDKMRQNSRANDPHADATLGSSGALPAGYE